jgi:hypothetical protein
MPGHPVVLEILHQAFHLHKAENRVVFCEVPGYVSLSGKVAVEADTKEASLHESLTSDRALHIDVRAFLHRSTLLS